MIQVTLKDDAYNELNFKFHKFEDAIGLVDHAMNHSTGNITVTIAPVANAVEVQKAISD